MNTSTKTIFQAGFVAGTLDIVGAIVVYSLMAQKMIAIPILQSVASGVFGKDAFAGGTSMAVYGLIFHYLIAMGFATTYFLFFPSISLFRTQKIISGILYGVIVWLIMNLIVVPLSNASQNPFTLKGAMIGMTILIVCVGFPISFIVHRHYTSRR